MIQQPAQSHPAAAPVPLSSRSRSTSNYSFSSSSRDSRATGSDKKRTAPLLAEQQTHLLHSQSGFTLIEVVVVIIILSIISLSVALKSDGADQAARHRATQLELEALAVAIRGSESINSAAPYFGYVGDVGSLPPNLTALMTNPGGYATWNGPYISQTNTADYTKDAWGTSYTYSGGLTVQSTGSGSSITKTIATTSAELLSNTVTGITLDARRFPPGSIYRDSVRIQIQHPNGSGSLTTTSVFPSSSGSFSLTGIPVGRHALTAITLHTADTVSRDITVTPGRTTTSELSFPVALW